MTILLLSVFILLYLYFAGYGVVRLFLPSDYWDILFLIPSIGLVFTVWLSTLFSGVGLGTDTSVYIILLIILILAIIGYKKSSKERRSLHISLEDNQEIHSPKPQNNIYSFLEQYITKHENVILLFFYIFGFVIASMPIIIKGQLTTFSWGNNDPAAYVMVAKFLMAHGYKIAATVTQNKPVTSLLVGVGSSRPGIFVLIAFISSLFKLDPFQIFSVLQGVFYGLIGPLAYIFTLKCLKATRTASTLAAVIIIINCNLLWVVYQGFAGQMSSYCLFFVALILFILTIENQNILIDYKSKIQLIKVCLILSMAFSVLYALYPESSVFLFGIMLLIALRYLLMRNMKPIVIFVCIFIISLIFNPYLVIATVKVLINTPFARPGWPLPKYALLTEAIGVYPLQYWGRVKSIYSLIISLFILGLIFIKNKKNIYLVISVMVPLFAILIWEGMVNHYSYGYFKSLTLYLPYVLIFLAIALDAMLFNNSSGDKVHSKYILFIGKAFVLVCLCLMIVASSYTTYTVSKNNVMVDQSIIDLASIGRLLPLNEPVYIMDEYTDPYWTELWTVYFLNKQDLYLDWVCGYLGGIKESRPPQGNYVLINPISVLQNSILSNESMILGGTTRTILCNDLYQISYVGQNNNITNNIVNVIWRDDIPNTIYPAEENFRWMNNDAILQITIPQKGIYYIKCKLYPGPGNTLPYRHLQIYQEDNLIDQFIVSKDISSYTIGPLYLNQGINNFRFHIVEPVTIFRMSNGDTRMLNMMIKEPAMYQLEAYKYKYGSELQFTVNNNNAQKYQGDGWSVPESWGTWTDGHEATLAIPVTKSNNDLILKINAANIFRKQTVGIVVNGDRLTTINMNADQLEYEVTIPKITTEASLLNITFELPDAISPKELQVGNDSRTLGMGVQYMTISEKQ